MVNIIMKNEQDYENNELLLLSADYDGKSKKALLKFYDPKNDNMVKWQDESDHLPYCIVKTENIDENRILVYAKGEKEPYVMDYNDGKFKKGDVLSQEYINKLKRKNLIEKAHQYNRRAKIIWLEDKRFDELRGGIIDY